MACFEPQLALAAIPLFLPLVRHLPVTSQDPSPPPFLRIPHPCRKRRCQNLLLVR